MNESQLQEKRKRIERMVKGGVAGFAVIIALGFVSGLIIAGVQALFAIVFAGIAGVTLVNLAPLVAFKFSNWRLKELKAEASKNPIETLQNQYGERHDALLRFKSAIETFVGEVKGFKDKLEGFKVQFPADAPKFEDQLNQMVKLLHIRKEKYKEAKGQLELFDQEISRAKAIWEMGLAAVAMNKASGDMEGDFMAKIKVETALDSVTSSMNMAFAELETSLLDEEKTPKQIAQNNVVPLLKVSGEKEDETYAPLKVAERRSVK